MDPSSPQNQAWCGGGGCFDLQELLSPCADEPRDIWETNCRGRSDSSESVASEASEEHSYVLPRPERFQDAYVLTRQVCNVDV